MIKTELEKHVNLLTRQILSMDWSNPEIYNKWLTQAYYYVSHATRMIALTGALTESNEYSKRCFKHIEEESGHDKMIINDLRLNGKTLSDYELYPASRAMVHSQYYYIQNVSPYSFIGYTILMEGIAVTCGKRVMEMVTLPGKTFLKVHTQEDEHHIEEAYKMAEQVPSEFQPVVINSISETCAIYSAVLSEIANSEAVRTKSAA